MSEVQFQDLGKAKVKKLDRETLSLLEDMEDNLLAVFENKTVHCRKIKILEFTYVFIVFVCGMVTR